MKGMSFGNSPMKNDKSKVDTKAVKKFTNLKEGKAGNILPQNKSLKPSAQEFLNRNTVKPKPHVKPKGVLGPGTRPLDPKVKKDISKVVRNTMSAGKQVAQKKVIKKAAKFVSRKLGLFGAALTAYDAVKSGANALHKAKNINYNDPKNVKLAEYKYGTKGKSKNMGKSKKIKKGDKIKAIGPDRD